jgi:hypothetical protein
MKYDFQRQEFLLANFPKMKLDFQKLMYVMYEGSLDHSRVRSLRSSIIYELYKNTLIKYGFFNLEFFNA